MNNIEQIVKAGTLWKRKCSRRNSEIWLLVGVLRIKSENFGNFVRYTLFKLGLDKLGRYCRWDDQLNYDVFLKEWERV